MLNRFEPLKNGVPHFENNTMGVPLALLNFRFATVPAFNQF